MISLHRVVGFLLLCSCLMALSIIIFRLSVLSVIHAKFSVNNRVSIARQGVLIKSGRKQLRSYILSQNSATSALHKIAQGPHEIDMNQKMHLINSFISFLQSTGQKGGRDKLSPSFETHTASQPIIIQLFGASKAQKKMYLIIKHIWNFLFYRNVVMPKLRHVETRYFEISTSQH